MKSVIVFLRLFHFTRRIKCCAGDSWNVSHNRHVIPPTQVYPAQHMVQFHCTTVFHQTRTVLSNSQRRCQYDNHKVGDFREVSKIQRMCLRVVDFFQKIVHPILLTPTTELRLVRFQSYPTCTENLRVRHFSFIVLDEEFSDSIPCFCTRICTNN
jgi:hypothetical protein